MKNDVLPERGCSAGHILTSNEDNDYYLQSNLNGLNTDGSFTMASSNLFLSFYEILPIAHENKILEKKFWFHDEIICCVYS